VRSVLPQSSQGHEGFDPPVSRRTFRWPGAARELVRAYLNTVPSRPSGTDGHSAQVGLKALITRIAAVSGNPRVACWRFVRQSGVTSKRSYRQWTKAEQQNLLDLIASRSLREVTMLLRRSPTSVHAMLHRLGTGSRTGQDWFTKHALAVSKRWLVEKPFAWLKQIGPPKKVKLGGLAKVEWLFVFSRAAFNLIRIPKLRAQSA
jgi:hypothetical protein